MGKRGSAAGRDDRPRIYIKGTGFGDRAAWRLGWNGQDRHAPDVGAAFVAALAHIKHQPAVILWEGIQDHD